jgi:hypothetical protein
MTRMTWKSSLFALVAAPLIVFGAYSSARAISFETFDADDYTGLLKVTIDSGDIGQSFDITWFLSSSASGFSEDLKAEGTFTIDAFTSTALDITITITNDTIGSFQAVITSFGFGVDPNATASLLNPGTVFDGVSAGMGPPQNFPGGFKQIDVCAFSDGCAGGNINNGLQSGGNSDTLQLRLSGNFGTDPTTAMLLKFPIQFQTEDGSVQFAGTTTVPVPSTLLLLGAGLLGLHWVQRRMQKGS